MNKATISTQLSCIDYLPLNHNLLQKHSLLQLTWQKREICKYQIL